jgi:hypothetical protein
MLRRGLALAAVVTVAANDLVERRHGRLRPLVRG